MGTSAEKNEDKLNNILKRIGYREVVDVYMKAILNGISTLLLVTPVTLIIFLTSMNNISIILALLFTYMVAFEMFLLDMVLKYSFGGTFGILLKLCYYGIQFFVLLAQT